MTPILNKRSIGEVGWGGKIPSYAELMRNVAFEIKSTPGFEDLSYQHFCCLRCISSVTVGRIDLDCWSNSYCALPHINPQWMSADGTEMYSINNPERWQQDHMCFIGQKLSSTSMHILLRKHLSAIFNPCLHPGASLSCVHHTLVAVGLVYLQLPVCV